MCLVQPHSCTSKWKSSQDTRPIANNASSNKAETSQPPLTGYF
jgi:hypothetical protein